MAHWLNAARAEVQQAARVLGIESEVLDIHDGELEPTLENRRKITRLIRQWNADIVMSHRPNDYHPDHRYTGVLVQDAAFMVTVPFFCPGHAAARRRTRCSSTIPIDFRKANPFTPDVIVAIDDVIDKKLDAVHSLPSQVYEGGASGSEAFEADVPKPTRPDARAWAKKVHGGRYAAVADKYRDALVRVVRAERGEGRAVCRGIRESASTAGNPMPRRVAEAVPVLGAVAFQQQTLCA